MAVLTIKLKPSAKTPIKTLKKKEITADHVCMARIYTSIAISRRCVQLSSEPPMDQAGLEIAVYRITLKKRKYTYTCNTYAPIKVTPHRPQ